jgi:hypothetical protein
MKTKVITMLLILSSSIGFSQDGEFEVHQNGLIYSENSVAQLKKIVDSLNLKFRTCDYKKVFMSPKQAKAHFIRLEKSKVSEAKMAIENGISFEEFLKKYSKTEFENDLLLVKHEYFDEYDKKDKVYISNLEFNRGDRYSIEKNKDEIRAFLNSNVNGKWMYTYYPKNEYSDASIEAFYFITDFISKPIANHYSRLIQYSECMIDTTTEVFSKKAIEKNTRYFDTVIQKSNLFTAYLDRTLKKPVFDKNMSIRMAELDYFDFESNDRNKKLSKKELAKQEEERKNIEDRYNNYYEELREWELSKFRKVDSLRLNDPNFMVLLKEAITDAKEGFSSDDEFELYVEKYLSKEDALELKRNRIVVGGCSMDSAPRIHAFNIALLSAETIKWEIFLRSHLNIMNDRFDRVSDGSYAQAGRKTYIKELEVLDINVLDLILGISLHVENPSQNHYYGSINRIGRALSESENKQEVEKSILAMIEDDDLDDYNRVLMYFLFDNYNYCLTDNGQKEVNKSRLANAVKKMPDYLASKITIE